MSINSFNQSTGGVNASLAANTQAALQRAAAVQGTSNSLSAQAADTALQNMKESFSAGNYAAGIKTEKDLLGKGVKLAAKV